MVITEPTWMRGLPGTAKFDSKTVAPIFGYSRAGCVTDAMKKGRFPQSDSIEKIRNPRGHSLRHYWKVSTIRKEIIRRANGK